MAFSKSENNDGHLGGGPPFYLKIIALVRVQDIGTFEVAIVSCYDNMTLLFS